MHKFLNTNKLKLTCTKIKFADNEIKFKNYKMSNNGRFIDRSKFLKGVGIILNNSSLGWKSNDYPR